LSVRAIVTDHWKEQKPKINFIYFFFQIKVMDIGKTFSSAFKCAFNAKRMLPYFIINLVIMGFIILLIRSLISSISSLNIISILSSVLLFIPVIIVMFLIKLFFDITITENASKYWKGRETAFNFAIAKKKYLSVLGASLLAGIITIIVSFVPTIGLLLSIIVSWFFLFIIPIIVLTNKDAVESLKTSYNVFMKNKFDVFVFWLLLSVITFLLALIALIPLIISAMPVVIGALKGSLSIGLIKSNILGLAIGGIITLIIMSYISVFEVAAKTFFYMQKKR